MKVLQKKVGEPWEIVSISGDKKSLERVVGGEPCFIPIGENYIISKKDAAFSDLHYNITFFGVQYFGTVIIAQGGGVLKSLENAKLIEELLNTQEPKVK